MRVCSSGVSAPRLDTTERDAMQDVTRSSTLQPIQQRRPTHVPQRSGTAESSAARGFLLRCVTLADRLVRALLLEGRSFFGRTRTLLGKRHWDVLLGPALERDTAGHLQSNSRTDARSDGIQALETRYRWANTIDAEIFLEGFDVGEEFALRTQRTQSHESVSSLALHDSSASRGQISDVTPAAIAGVTRKV